MDYFCEFKYDVKWEGLLTHWGWVMHICVVNLIIIGSDNGLSPDRLQAIIRTNDGILLIGPLRTKFSEILIKIQAFSFKKMHLKISIGKWWPLCLGLSVLVHWGWGTSSVALISLHFKTVQQIKDRHIEPRTKWLHNFADQHFEINLFPCLEIVTVICLQKVHSAINQDWFG